MVGPSAVGSEKGIPSSIQSAPPFSKARRILSVVARSGSPAVRKGISAASPLLCRSANFLSIQLMVRTGASKIQGSGLKVKKNLKLEPHLESHPEIIPDCSHVLISPSGETDDDGLVFG